MCESYGLCWSFCDSSERGNAYLRPSLGPADGHLHATPSPGHGHLASFMSSCPIFSPPCTLLNFFFSFSSLFILLFLSQTAINSDAQNQGCCSNAQPRNLLWRSCGTFSVLCFLTKCRIVFSNWGVLSRIRIYFHTSFILFYLCVLV